MNEGQADQETVAIMISKNDDSFTGQGGRMGLLTAKPMHVYISPRI